MIPRRLWVWLAGIFLFTGLLFPAVASAAGPLGTDPSSTPAHRFDGANSALILIAAFMVMFMQAGFALMETGLCRAKNAAHTMSVNFLVYALSMTGFFICGYALMTGGSAGGMFQLGNSAPGVHDGWRIFGTSGFLLGEKNFDSNTAVSFLFMTVCMNLTATILTGPLAERWSFKSFFVFSLFVGAIIYPIYACWTLGGGWLAQLGAKAGFGHGVVDYAGSSFIHLQGGAIALITCYLLGPRIGKYDDNGNPQPILGHHIPMVILGTFITVFGWFGLTMGSSLILGDGRAGIIAVNTMLASAAGALLSCVYMWLRFGKPDPSIMCNGMLAGLVAISAPCAFVRPGAAFLIGAIAGVLVTFSLFFWERRGIDDPVGAISVHGVGGLWGMLALGLFADGTYGQGWNGVGTGTNLGEAAKGVAGLFYGDSKQFAAQCIGCGVCIAWNLIVAGFIFAAIGRMFGSNRVPPEVEIAGLDIPEVGAPGYPEFIHHVAQENVPSSEIAAARANLSL